MNDTLNTKESNQANSISKPKLWSPNAAANWSLIFSSVFGAILHAKNWAELEQPDKAKTNQKRAIGFFVFLIIAILIPQIKLLDGLMKLVGLILLLTWYFSQARQQVKFIKEKYGEEFEKKKWGQPILIGLDVLLG